MADDRTSYAETVEATRATHAPDGASRRYLAVFEPGGSRVVDLPEAGELVIGRGVEAALRVSDAKVSRRQAVLTLSPEGAVLADLDSRNGTLVNGTRLTAPRPLVSGDVIAMSQSSLVFHARAAAAAPRAADDFAAFRRALARELERASHADRPLALLSLLRDGDDELAGPARAAFAATELEPAAALARIAPDGPRRALALLPETTEVEAAAVAHELLTALARAGVAARVGVAVPPGDGADVDTLLTSARAAADAAPPRGVESAGRAFRVLHIGPHEVLLADPAMLRLYGLLERLAVATDLPVLVHGETGSGKELVASALHYASARRAARLVTLNCAALTESLVESELFGHEKGAFTGASASKPGLLEVAAGGTVFLDEVGELSPAIQAKLLRALDTRRITRVGEVSERPIDVRVVAATHRDLSREVAAGRFRQDLFFRLSGATVWVPPLRDRPRELALLARRFLYAACARAGRAPMRIADDAQRVLARHSWPGNVRELRYTMEFVAAAFPDPVLEPFHLEARLAAAAATAPTPPVATPAAAPPPPPSLPPGAPQFRPLEDEIRELERTRMLAALEAAGGNQRRAAQLIAMPLRTFVTRLAQHGIRGRRREPA